MNRSRPFSITFHHDLAVILGLSFLLILAIYLLPMPVLRLILGGPFVLFFPGYTMVAALFPGRDDLEGLERLGLSLGLSIAILPLMGLVLNYTPFGITLHSTVVSATAFIAVTCAIAYFRRGRLVPNERFALRLELDVAGWRQSGILDKSLTAALAVSVAMAVGTFLFVLAKPEVGERFTEFYVLGPYGEADDYPERVVQGQPVYLIIGVLNREHEDVEYRIQVQAAGQPVAEIPGIQLAHDGRWVRRVVFALEEPGDQQRVEFLLYRQGRAEPYRSLHLWIDVLPIETPGTDPTPPTSSLPKPFPSPTSEVPAAATPAEAPTQEPSASPAPLVTHTVLPGATLSSIARLYGVTVQAIMAANGMDDPNLLQPGQELAIPVPE